MTDPTPPIPLTVVTGFLGSGKTTLILNLIRQLPPAYKLAILKNEFGNVAVDSELLSSSAVSGVQELLNGCICCNLVGQLGDALETLRRDYKPDRIVIETSGSAFPATLALEINRLAKETRGAFMLDGVVTVIDVENWQGYEDTSFTAKLQARYTDLIVFNKWEEAGERKMDVCLDRIGDLELEVQIPTVRSNRGLVRRDLLLGVDRMLSHRAMDLMQAEQIHTHQHQNEVEVLSVVLSHAKGVEGGIDVGRLERFLREASKEEIYRIKGSIIASRAPASSDDTVEGKSKSANGSKFQRYVLNWAFGRWTFTPIHSDAQADLARITMIFARSESERWKLRLLKDNTFAAEDSAMGGKLTVERLT